MTPRLILIGCILFCGFSVLTPAYESELHRALEDELQRNMEELSIEGLPDPYFISYTVHDDHSATIEASAGGIQNQTIRRTRRLNVLVRVGSPELDNTNFYGDGPSNLSIPTSLPLEDDYELIRKQIWLATDRAYRNAAETYSTKIAAMQNTVVPEDRIPDFSQESPITFVDKQKSQTLDIPEIRKTVRDLSKFAKNYEFVYHDQVTAFANQHTDTYINSEGSYFSRVDDTAYIRAFAWTQAEDGRSLADHVAIVGRDWRSVQRDADPKRQVKAMFKRLEALREAGTLERYNGPLLVQDQAAGEVVAQLLAPYFLNYKEPVHISRSRSFSLLDLFKDTTFKEKLGARVLPRGWNVYDDPTIEKYKGETLVGQYPVDSDGLLTRRVTLVKNGILQTLLTDRNPTKDFPKSTASNATSAGPTPSNLIIETTGGQSSKELKENLLDLVSEYGLEYGLRVDYIPTPFVALPGVPTSRGRMASRSSLSTTRVFKVYPDGTEELIRNAVISSPLVPELKNLAGYSDRTSVQSGIYAFESGDITMRGLEFPIYVSTVTPDLLFEDVTVIGQDGIVRSRPLMSPPR